MGRKSTSTAVTKNSSASLSSVTASGTKSSVLKSAFAPSNLQLHLFASVIQSFNSQQLRIHDTNTGRLRCQHETNPGSSITCLDWGYYGAAYREQKQTPKKKRKRDQEASEGAVVAYGTSTSEICMFSPAEGKIIGTLQGVHERGIKDFKFSHPDHTEGWSIGGDGKLVQWDLIEGRAIRTIALPDPAISILASPSQRAPRMLCASSTPFAIDLKSPEDFHIDRYDAFKNAVHALVRSDFGDSTTSEHFLAADTDRYINVYDMSLKRLVRTLVAGSGAMQIDFTSPAQNTRDVLDRQMLAVVTKDGSVELFAHPFVQAKQVNGDLKSNRKNLTTKASAQVRLINPDHKSKHVAILAASLQGPDLLIASADSGVDLAFQKVRWQDEGNGELLFDGTKEVVKVRGASTLNTANLNGAKDMGKSHVDESRTVVVNGGLGGPHSDAIEISSSEDEAGESADDEDDNVKEESDEEPSEAESDEEMVDADNDDKSDKNALDEDLEEGPTEEPTFGEQLAAKHPGTISIIDAFKPEESAITFNDNRPTIPSGMSLGTVLTQSLRTNDNNLLEACLHTLDISIVKTTIQRLDSSLAGILLSKLAERLATRPGRYGHLITWVQWTCIAHGGAIAAQPDVTAKVRTLYQVLSQRSKTLDSLLLLKGKLDMLEAQLSYRKQLAAQRAVQGNDAEPGMIYIEGADNWESTDEDELDEDYNRPVKKLAAGKGKPKASKRALDDLIADEESSGDEDLMPLENGEVDSDDEDEDESDEDDEAAHGINGLRNGIMDIEAEESSGADDSDPDDVRGRLSSTSASSSATDSDEEDRLEDDDDEEDSEMDSFINDGEIDLEEDEDDIVIPGDNDDEDEVMAEPEPELKVKSKSATKPVAQTKSKSSNSKSDPKKKMKRG